MNFHRFWINKLSDIFPISPQLWDISSLECVLQVCQMLVKNMLDLWKLHSTLCTLNHSHPAPYISHILYNISYVPHLEPSHLELCTPRILYPSHPTPCTLHTLHPLHSVPCTVHPAPLHPTPFTPFTLQSISCTPHILHPSYSTPPYPAPMSVLKYDCLPPIPFQILNSIQSLY